MQLIQLLPRVLHQALQWMRKRLTSLIPLLSVNMFRTGGGKGKSIINEEKALVSKISKECYSSSSIGS